MIFCQPLAKKNSKLPRTSLQPTKGELSAGQTSVEDLELIIHNLNIEIERHKEENRKISILLDNLKLEIKELTRRNAALQARVFSVNRFLESDKDVNFLYWIPRQVCFRETVRIFRSWNVRRKHQLLTFHRGLIMWLTGRSKS